MWKFIGAFVLRQGAFKFKQTGNFIEISDSHWLDVDRSTKFSLRQQILLSVHDLQTTKGAVEGSSALDTLAYSFLKEYLLAPK